MMKHFIFTILLLALAGTVRAEGKRILFIGDSITDGNWGNSNGGAQPSSERCLWDMNHIYGSGYMYLCASHYQSKYPEEEFVFMNRGISGNTLDDLERRWEEDVVALRPDVLSILIGTNDVNGWLDRNDGTPFDVEAWKQKYRSLLERVRQVYPQVELVLGEPFVACTGSMKQKARYAERDSIIGELGKCLDEFEKDFGALRISFARLFRNLLLYEPTSQDTYWIWDGIHPTPAGHRRMADLWIERVDSAGCLFRK